LAGGPATAVVAAFLGGQDFALCVVRDTGGAFGGAWGSIASVHVGTFAGGASEGGGGTAKVLRYSSVGDRRLEMRHYPAVMSLTMAAAWLVAATRLIAADMDLVLSFGLLPLGSLATFPLADT